MYTALNKGIHYEPLRPNRAMGIKDKYEFTHGDGTVCVYDIETMDFVIHQFTATIFCHKLFSDNFSRNIFIWPLSVT